MLIALSTRNGLLSRSDAGSQSKGNGQTNTAEAELMLKVETPTHVCPFPALYLWCLLSEWRMERAWQQ